MIGQSGGTLGSHWRGPPEDNRSYVLADNLDAFHLWTEIAPNKAKKITFDSSRHETGVRRGQADADLQGRVRTVKMTFPWNEHLSKRLVMHILVDRGSVEVFADGGLVAMSIAALPEEKNRAVELHVEGDAIDIVQMHIHRMQSAWEK